MKITTVVIAGCTALLAFTVAIPAAATAASEPPRAGAAIVGGSQLSPAEPRFVVGVLSRGRMICSGTLVSTTRVLTAGHCSTEPELSVVTGRDRLSDPSLGEVIPVAAAVPFPTFNLRRPTNDIAVLTLATPSTAATAVLPTAAEAEAATVLGQPVTAAGFGRQNPTFVGREQVGDLRVLGMRVGGRCPRFFKRFKPVTMLCSIAGFLHKRLKVRRTPCFGDSGGPLVSRLADGRLAVVGVISFGRNPRGKLLGLACGQGPAVSTRVSAFLPFIAANMAP